MTPSTVIEVLDEVGGWVHPLELDYQLALRGEPAGAAAIAGLCRDGVIRIDPAGYTLSADAAPRRFDVRDRIGMRQPAAELVLKAMHDSPTTWWSSKDLAVRIGRPRNTVLRACDLLVDVELLVSELDHGKPGKPERRFALCERVGVLL